MGDDKRNGVGSKRGNPPRKGSERAPEPPKPGKAKQKTIPKGRIRQGRSRS